MPLALHRARLWLALRMMIATTLAYALANALRQPQSYWAVLTAIIVTQHHTRRGYHPRTVDRRPGTHSRQRLRGRATAARPRRFCGTHTRSNDMDSVGSVRALPALWLVQVPLRESAPEGWLFLCALCERSSLFTPRYILTSGGTGPTCSDSASSKTSRSAFVIRFCCNRY